MLFLYLKNSPGGNFEKTFWKEVLGLITPILVCLVMIAVGFVLGSSYTDYKIGTTAVGTLRVIEDDEQPYIFLELKDSVDNVVINKHVYLDVEYTKQYSHK